MGSGGEPGTQDGNSAQEARSGIPAYVNTPKAQSSQVTALIHSAVAVTFT